LGALFKTSFARSWRHTPFRKKVNGAAVANNRSWRHTPFRNENGEMKQNGKCSWRHTPFRNVGLFYAR